MNKFVYVFNEKDKLRLIELGYHLLQEMPSSAMYVFENKSGVTFDLLDKSKYMLTNTLVF